MSTSLPLTKKLPVVGTLVTAISQIPSLKKHAPETVILEKKPVRTDFTAIAQQYEQAIAQAEAEKQAKAVKEAEWDFMPTLQSILTSKRCIHAVISAHDEHGGDKKDYGPALVAAVESLKPGLPAEMGVVYAAGADLPTTFIRTKIKPVMESVGLLVKINDKSYRWASKNELLKIAKNGSKVETRWSIPTVGRLFDRVNGALIAAENARIDRDAWKKRNADGSVTKIKKPFEGALTEEEKQLKRDEAKRLAFEKLKGASGLSTDAEIDIQKIKDNAEKKRVQAAIEWKQNMQMLQHWGGILALGLLAMFLFSAMTYSSAPDVQMPEEMAVFGVGE